jgi:hypothetical protein
MGTGVLLGLAVTVGALCFAFGLMGRSNGILIGLGLLIFALCAIFGAQPGWPRRRVD